MTCRDISSYIVSHGVRLLCVHCQADTTVGSCLQIRASGSSTKAGALAVPEWLMNDGESGTGSRQGVGDSNAFGWQPCEALLLRFKVLVSLGDLL